MEQGGNVYSLLPITGEIAPNADVLSFEGNWQTGRKRRYFPLPEEEPVICKQIERVCSRVFTRI